ncbi:MAG: copper resistance protein CopC [Nocardioides sp.]
MRRLLLRRSVRPAAGLALVCGLVLLSTSPASAHGDLLEGSPGPGDEVAIGTTSVRLVFTALDPDSVPSVAIIDPDGEQVALGSPALADDQTICATSAPLADGIHTLAYSVSSADGDRQTSMYAFAVSSTGSAAQPGICADLAAEPGQASTVGEGDARTGSGTVPASVLYGLGALGVLATGLVALRIRGDRRRHRSTGVISTPRTARRRTG